MGEFHDRFDRVDDGTVDQLIGTRLSGECEPFARQIDRDHPRSHVPCEQRRAEPDRTQPEDCDGLASREAHAREGGECSAGAA